MERDRSVSGSVKAHFQPVALWEESGGLVLPERGGGSRLGSF